MDLDDELEEFNEYFKRSPLLSIDFEQNFQPIKCPIKDKVVDNEENIKEFLDITDILWPLKLNFDLWADSSDILEPIFELLIATYDLFVQFFYCQKSLESIMSIPQRLMYITPKNTSDCRYIFRVDRGRHHSKYTKAQVYTAGLCATQGAARLKCFSYDGIAALYFGSENSHAFFSKEKVKIELKKKTFQTYIELIPPVIVKKAWTLDIGLTFLSQDKSGCQTLLSSKDGMFKIILTRFELAVIVQGSGMREFSVDLKKDKFQRIRILLIFSKNQVTCVCNQKSETVSWESPVFDATTALSYIGNCPSFKTSFCGAITHFRVFDYAFRNEDIKICKSSPYKTMMCDTKNVINITA